MYHSFHTAVQDPILGNAGAMEEFLKTIVDDDPRRIQLAKDHTDYSKKCVPIIIHGDGVPCARSRFLDTISFESVLAKTRSWAQLAEHWITFSL